MTRTAENDPDPLSRVPPAVVARRSHMVNLVQLRVLLAVGDCGSFSGAEHVLHTVQSNVSTHVAHLEDELGVPLVDRARNTLTEEGRCVAARARSITAECDAMVEDVRALGGPVGGTVRIGIIGTVARWLAPHLLGELRACHPGIHLLVAEGTSTALVDQLLACQLDTVVVRAGATPGTVAVPLFDEELLLVLPPDHHFPRRSAVRLTDLVGLDLLLPSPGTAYRPELEEACRLSGVELTAAAELDGVHLIASLVFDGHGAAILPATAIPSWLRAHCRIVRVLGLPRRRVALTTRAQSRPSAAGRAVIDLLTELVARHDDNPPGIRLLADQQ